MSEATAKRSRSLAKLQKTLDRVSEKLRTLGLNLSVWDQLGRRVGPWQAAGPFCEFVCGDRFRCHEVMHELAEQILAVGRPAKSCSLAGCCLLGVPLRERRRLAGVAVVCFPVREMLEEEFFSRLCSRLELDRQVMEKFARRQIHHSTDEVDDFLNILNWLLQGEQDLQNAQDELGNLSMNLATTYEELSLLYQISGSIKVTRQPRNFLQSLCSELLAVTSIEAMAGLLYAYPPAIDRDLVVCEGRLDMTTEQIDVLMRQTVASRLSESHRAFVENEFRAPPDSGYEGAIRNLVASPLVVDDNLIGMLVGLNKGAGDFDSVDLKLINSIANQAAVFLANHRLYADMQDLLMGVLHALTAAIDAKDPYTCGHSQRVALISKRLAEESGFSEAKVQQVYLAGLLHDIGKIGVPEAVLCKPGRLTEEEFGAIRKHPVMGARILGGIRQLDHVEAGILAHHERPDGKGYPNGLKADQLSIEGLLVGLADSLDAMTSDRTYRRALPLKKVIDEIRANAGKQFDKGLVELLLSLDIEKFIEEVRQSAQTVLPISVPKEMRE